MRNNARWIAGLGLGLACLLALFAAACSSTHPTVLAPPEIEGASYVGNRVCSDCHTNYFRNFAQSPHGRFHKDEAGFAGRTGCESCHGPGSKHVAAGGGRGKFIVNPGKDPAACFNCHLEVAAEFHLPQHHPVMEKHMGCVQCHDPHGPDIFHATGGATLAMARQNEGCAKCHREQARPVVFEHEAMREGCTTCHQPHGSINQKLLVERDNNLCLKCHAQIQTNSGEIVIGKVDHTSLIARATCWTAGCHNAVHGSNVSPHLRY